MKIRLILSTFIFFFITTTLFAATKQDRLSFEDGTQFLNEIIQKNKSISRILFSIDSLEKDDFVSIEAYAEFLIYSEEKLRVNYEAELIDFTFKMSEFFQEYSMHQNAYIYLNRTLRLVELYPNKAKNILNSKLYEDIGLSYYYFRRMNLAKHWLFKAINEEEVPPVSEINIYNTIAMIYRNQMQSDSSKIYFEKALSFAKKYQKKEWIGIISGNLGYFYFKKEDYIKARKLIEIDLSVSIETNQYNSALLAQCLLSEIDIIENKLEDANSKLTEAAQLLEDRPFLEGKYAFQNVKTKYLEKISDFEGAYRSYQKAISFKDSISYRLNLENFSNIEFQLNFEKKQAEIETLQQRKKQSEQIIYILFAFIITVIVSFILIFYQYKKRKRREKEILNIEKIRIENELQNTETQMRKVLQDLINKNQLVENLNEEIDQIKLNDTDSKLQIETAKISDKLQSFVLLTEEDWLEFKKLFEKLNPGFFNHFADNYPDLTNAEVRLAALIKLNLSNLEMAHTLGISPNSVRKTNLRLRKRLGIEEQTDLMKLIKEIK